MCFRMLFLAALWNINQVWEGLKKVRKTSREALMIKQKRRGLEKPGYRIQEGEQICRKR